MYNWKIKLISPPLLEPLKSVNLEFVGHFNYYLMPSYGMGIMTAALRQKGYHVEQEDLILKNKELRDKYSFYLYDYWDSIPKIIKTGSGTRQINDMIEEVFNSISMEGFNAVGFSILSFGHFLTAIMLAKRIRYISDVPIIFGGAFITLYGKLYPEILDYVNCMVVGDGRNALLEVLEYFQNKKKNLDTISNIIYKKGDQIITTKFATYPLEDVPPPDFTGLPLDLYRNPLNGELVLPYEITRGCLHRCNFCVRSPIEKTFEVKSYNKVIKELEEMKKKYNRPILYFCDSNISNSRQYLDHLLERLIQDNIKLTWRVYSDVRAMSQSMITKIRRAGCDALMYGIETGSERILKMIDKDQTPQQAKQALMWTKSAGIKVTAFFMAGYPHEEKSDIEDTINFISNNREYIDFGVVRKFTVVSESFIHQQPLRYGICNLKPQNSRYTFDFDEMHGLHWRKKTLQQEAIKRRVEAALMHNIYHEQF